MYRLLQYIAIAASVPACQGQGLLDQGNPLSAARDGARLYEVSVFSGYSTSALPSTGGGQFIPSTIGGLSADVNYGARFSLGWQRHREKGGFSMRYSGTYSGLVHYSDANGYSQALSLGADRKLSPKWGFNLSASGQDATLQQALNEPSAISVVSQLPSDFNDFAAAFGLGDFSTSQAASTILGAPVLQTPLRALLLGSKVLSYSGSGGLTYTYSRHLSLHASSSASGGENRAGSQSGIPQTNYLLPFNFEASAGMNWSYSRSPRTELGFSLQADRMLNHFQSSYGGTAMASFARKMGSHWFFKIHGGATLTEVTQQLYGTPRTRQAVGGGSIGIKTYTNSFVTSYERSASDSYGLVGTYTTLSGAWNRHHPGSRLSLFAGVGQQQVRNTGFEGFSGWQASGGWSETLKPTTTLQAQYVYFTSGSSYLGSANSFSVHSVRLSMNWSPEPGQR
jgi:hypothetical protein